MALEIINPIIETGTAVIPIIPKTAATPVPKGTAYAWIIAPIDHIIIAHVYKDNKVFEYKQINLLNFVEGSSI